MSHVSFIAAPFKGDRGKRQYEHKAAYTHGDYLKDTRPEAQKQTPLVGQSDPRSCKFHAGFYRRPGASIQPDAERLAYESTRASSAARREEARSAALAAEHTRNGNVLSPPPLAPREDVKLFPHRRGFPQRGEEVAAQNHARQKVGAARFHVELSESELDRRAQIVGARLHATEQRSSVLGFGRADLPTGGVVDNFRAHAPYTGADIISKPKRRPPPPDSQAARYNPLEHVQLEDASVNYGRRAGSARPNRTAHGGAAAAGANVGSTKNNITSAGMAEVMCHANIAAAAPRKGADGGGAAGASSS